MRQNNILTSAVLLFDLLIYSIYFNEVPSSKLLVLTSRLYHRLDIKYLIYLCYYFIKIVLELLTSIIIHLKAALSL